MNPLNVIPTAWLLPTAGVAASLMVAAISIQSVRLHFEQAATAEAKAETVKVQGAWDLDRAQATAAALAQTTAYRAEEQRRAAAHQEIVDEADRKILAARADAVVADAAAGKLRDRVVALVAQARATTGNPAAAQGSPPADDAIGMLAELQRRADARAGFLAYFADRASIAGQACERAYKSLIVSAVTTGY